MAFIHGDLALEMGRFAQTYFFQQLIKYEDIQRNTSQVPRPTSSTKTWSKKASYNCSFVNGQDQIIDLIQPDVLCEQIAEQFYRFAIDKTSGLVLPVTILQPIVTCYVEPMNLDYVFNFRVSCFI